VSRPIPEPAAPARVRLDRWLWAARFFKTRALAALAIDGGKVRVNGDRAKRARLIGAGDSVEVRLGPYLHQVVVRGLAERRRPARDALGLFGETEASKSERERVAFQLKAAHVLFTTDSRGRPTKRERRQMERLRGFDGGGDD
jgi:ribosome-associated heat shock protein Hsp15